MLSSFIIFDTVPVQWMASVLKTRIKTFAGTMHHSTEYCAVYSHLDEAEGLNKICHHLTLICIFIQLRKK